MEILDPLCEPLNPLSDYVLDKVGPMDTTHNISMVRVNYEEGANIASLTATSTAQHALSGTGKDADGAKYTVGGEYSVELIKDEANIWKMKKLVLNVVWTAGDASLMRPSEKSA